MSDSQLTPFIPLSAPVLGEREKSLVSECVASGWISSAGPWVGKFEKNFADYLGVAEAVAVASGTAALHLSLLLSEVGPRDEVIVPTVTFIAPINGVRYCGAQPVFMDCDSHLNLGPL